MTDQLGFRASGPWGDQPPAFICDGHHSLTGSYERCWQNGTNRRLSLLSLGRCRNHGGVSFKISEGGAYRDHQPLQCPLYVLSSRLHGPEKGVYGPQELYEKIVTECAEAGCSVLHLHNFGEPLLDRQLSRRIRFAKNRGIRWVKIFTNGALLRNGVAKGLLKSGLDEIKISMDGASAIEFNRLRQGLDHAEVLENVMAFKEMRDLLGLKHPIITATCVQTSSRKKTRERLRDVTDKVIFADLHNWGGEGRLIRKRHIRQPCSRLWQTFTILVTGEVALCCMDHAGKVVLGHCGRQTIANIWESQSYRKVRRLHRNSEQYRILLCNECSMSFFPPTLSSYRNDA